MPAAPCRRLPRHRITEWWGLEGTSVCPPAQPPAQAGSPRAGCTAPRPGGLEYLQRRRLPSPSGQPGPGLRHPQREEVLPRVQLELPLPQFVPVAPCPVTGHRCREFGAPQSCWSPACHCSWGTPGLFPVDLSPSSLLLLLLGALGGSGLLCHSLGNCVSTCPVRVPAQVHMCERQHTCHACACLEGERQPHNLDNPA